MAELLRGYSAKNVWNLDEMGWNVSGVLFQNMVFLCKGGKKLNNRFNCYNYNAAGGKESAIVVWKAEEQRCFKGINVSKLPVKYFIQANAWMTGEILDEVLTELNHRLSSCSRSIVLLLDNIGYHPHDLKGKYSNIRIIFLPPQYHVTDTTS